MSLPEAGYGSEEGYVGSEISGAVSGVTTPGASRLQASQLQQRSTAMQRLHGTRGNHDSASGISTDTLRSSDFSGAITRRESLRVPPEVTFVASPQRTEDQPSECPYCGHRQSPGVHTCADCCVNAPPNLKPGRESPSSSESGSSSHAVPDLEDSSSEGEQSGTGISGDYWENHFQQIWNEEFLQRAELTAGGGGLSWPPERLVQGVAPVPQGQRPVEIRRPIAGARGLGGADGPARPPGRRDGADGHHRRGKTLECASARWFVGRLESERRRGRRNEV